MSPAETFSVGQVLLPAAAMFFLVWSLAGVLVGAGLIARSPGVFRLFDTLNRYVSTRRGLKVMSMPHDIGRNVHRHRLWIGPLFIIGATYSIYGLGARFDNDAIVASLALGYPQGLVAWLLESVRWSLILFSLFAIVVGVMLSYFHGSLGRMEDRLDRWYSVRKPTLGIDAMHMQPDNWVAAHPRTAGSIIVVASLYVGANALMQWLVLR